jgi:uncharacterized protein (UPF0335 family)
MSNVESTTILIGNHPQPAPPIGDNVSKAAAAQLRTVVERIEKLEEEKAGLAEDVRGIYSEAKGNGYDVKALRTIIRLRKMSEGDRTEQETILDTYKHALGMLV